MLEEKEGQLPHQKQFCDFLKSVGEVAKRNCKDIPNEIGCKVSDEDLKKILSCVFVKNNVATLYAKAQHNPTTGQFYTNFLDKQGESKRLEPKEIIGKRCTVNAVICPDSIFVSSTHVSLQVKVAQVLMEFAEPEVEQVIETLVEER